MKSINFGAWWAKWKLRLIAGVAILVALAIAVFAAHHIGYTKGKNLSKVEVERYQTEKAQLQTRLIQAQSKVNEVVITEYKDRIIYQDRVVYKNRDVIREVIVNRPGQQTVSEGFIYAHNQAALGRPIDPEQASNPEPSGVTDSEVLETVSDNYDIGQRAIIKLESLQRWVRDTWEVKDEVTE